MKVFIAHNPKSNDGIFHTKENCPYIQRAEKIRTTSKNRAKNIEGKTECKWCSGEYTVKGYSEWHDINRKLANGEIDL